MTLQLFGHPSSSYTQKALIALHWNGTEFERRWLAAKFPLLVDGDTRVFEVKSLNV